jgi:hypothetical protein
MLRSAFFAASALAAVAGGCGRSSDGKGGGVSAAGSHLSCAFQPDASAPTTLAACRGDLDDAALDDAIAIVDAFEHGVVPLTS